MPDSLGGQVPYSSTAQHSTAQHSTAADRQPAKAKAKAKAEAKAESSNGWMDGGRLIAQLLS